MSFKALIATFFSICILALGSSAIASPSSTQHTESEDFLTHLVKPKETYYALAQRYHLPVKLIMDYNGNKPLKVGTTLKIPVISTNQGEAGSVREVPKPIVNNSNTIADTTRFINYHVGTQETLFSIAKRFNISISKIKDANHLQNDNLLAGSILKIPQYGLATADTSSLSPAAGAASVAPDKTKTILGTPNPLDSNHIDTVRPNTNRYGLHEQAEHGIALWIDDVSLDSSKMLALHRVAPVGTVIKITNPMNNKSTFAKVVGKFTPSETTKDVIIVITKTTAGVIGALDKRFQVNLEYGVPNG